MVAAQNSEDDCQIYKASCPVKVCIINALHHQMRQGKLPG